MTDTLPIGARAHVTLSGRYNRTSIRNRDRDRAGRRARVARRRPCLRAVQSGGRRDVRRRPARSTSMPATAKAAAPRRRSSWAAPTPKSPASCRTRWPAIRRSNQVVTRTVGGRHPRHARRLSLERRRVPRREPRRHPVRHVGADRLRLLQELRRDPPPGARARRAAASVGRADVRRGLHLPAAPPSRARRPSTARATAPTTRPRTASRGSRARSRSSPAIGCRSSRGTC